MASSVLYNISLFFRPRRIHIIIDRDIKHKNTKGIKIHTTELKAFLYHACTF